MNRFRLRCLATVGILLAAFATAPAAPLSLSHEGINPVVSGAGQFNWNTGSTTYSNIVYTPYGNGSSSANHFITFCIEQNQHITTLDNYEISTLTSSPIPGSGMSQAAADALRAMWAEFRDDLDVADRANRSAAFQNAVWHLVDPGFNPSMSGPVSGYYSMYLNSANWHSGLANLATLSSPTQQDQILEIQIQSTPEPTTLMLGLLVAPAIYLRRRWANRAV
jgi:hypothetical protein